MEKILYRIKMGMAIFRKINIGRNSEDKKFHEGYIVKRENELIAISPQDGLTFGWEWYRESELEIRKDFAPQEVEAFS